MKLDGNEDGTLTITVHPGETMSCNHCGAIQVVNGEGKGVLIRSAVESERAKVVAEIVAWLRTQAQTRAMFRSLVALADAIERGEWEKK